MILNDKVSNRWNRMILKFKRVIIWNEYERKLGVETIKSESLLKKLDDVPRGWTMDSIKQTCQLAQKSKTQLPPYFSLLDNVSPSKNLRERKYVLLLSCENM